MDKAFARDVVEGLSSTPKYLSSKYFYDDKGDRLFQKIMSLDDYYLTRAEYDIFSRHKEAMLEIFLNPVKRFQLLEFGAGDGLKTKVLLRHFLEKGAEFTYLPIDISGSVLKTLEKSLLKEMPQLSVQGMEGEYFAVLDGFKKHKKSVRNIILFLGSNIGNFTWKQAVKFLSGIKDNLAEQDLLMVGFDLKKDPLKILKAYGDDEGVTSEFNLNLLDRINREFDGNINRDSFKHHPVYDPVTGEARSYLISLDDQQVELKALDKKFMFDKWEPIFMEISRKFNYHDIKKLATEAGLNIFAKFEDENDYFADVIFRRV